MYCARRDIAFTMKVFLGGTCNGSTWRETLKPLLYEINVDYYDPVVEDWTPECMEEEIYQRETCDMCLYVITVEMTGAFAIAEVVDDSNKRPEKTIFCFLEPGLTMHQVASLGQVAKMVANNGGFACNTLGAVVDKLVKESK